MTVSSWYPCFPLVPYTPLSTQKPALCFVNKSDVLKTQGCFPTSLRVKVKLLTIPNQPLCELRPPSGPLILFLVTLLIFCLPKPPRLRAVSHAHQAHCTQCPCIALPRPRFSSRYPLAQFLHPLQVRLLERPYLVILYYHLLPPPVHPPAPHILFPLPCFNAFL